MSSNADTIRAKVQAVFDDHKKRTSAVVENLMRANATAILGLALQYCPMDTGALRATGRVEQKSGGYGFDAVFTVAFGGLGAVGPVVNPERLSAGRYVDYAVIVHERTDQNINWTTPGTGAKYLERAANEFVALNPYGVPFTADVGEF